MKRRLLIPIMSTSVKSYLLFMGGNNNQIGKYSGTALSGATITVPGNVVKIRLTTDGSVVRYGFQVTSITTRTYEESTSGLIYLRARWYDPSIGRFISEDPIKSGLNWYIYGNNNPLRFFDPWGLVATSIRLYTDERGGTVTWNEQTSISTFTLFDKTLETLSSGKNDYGLNVWNSNGRMMADDKELDEFFGIVQMEKMIINDKHINFAVQQRGNNYYLNVVEVNYYPGDGSYYNFKKPGKKLATLNIPGKITYLNSRELDGVDRVVYGRFGEHAEGVSDMFGGVDERFSVILTAMDAIGVNPLGTPLGGADTVVNFMTENMMSFGYTMILGTKASNVSQTTYYGTWY